MRKILTILVALVLLLSCSSTAFAGAENEIDKVFLESNSKIGLRYALISYTNTMLNINSNGQAECLATIKAYSGSDRVKISGYLQYYDNGWITLKHWTKESEGNYGSIAKNWYVPKGRRYRFQVYYYVYKGDQTETTSKAAYRNF